METLTGFTSDASGPRTPPYTPHRKKYKPTRASSITGRCQLERSASPASSASVQPAETESPSKKTAKLEVSASDGVDKEEEKGNETLKVEELLEGDVGYITDIDVVYPEELEEANSSDSHSAGFTTSSDLDSDSDSDDAVARKLSRLRCGDENAEANFEEGRRLRRLSKRNMGSRLVKRTHSQSAKGDTMSDFTDLEAIDDHDRADSQRRLRRRVKGPQEAAIAFEDLPRSSTDTLGRDNSGFGSRTGVSDGDPVVPSARDRDHTTKLPVDSNEDIEYEVMDVDDSNDDSNDDGHDDEDDEDVMD
ncbi:hypothetical protein M433DRAFT_136443 [Acidomyces richmondensis BFW]|nr:MAG: hypothetical protein FE78DRAFT_34453 [Acidomyces sp. 'richmondensis']KYG43432.1 hypothetical protein M433DRAFT_136443 [Acidomyces richmondensis BFW]